MTSEGTEGMILKLLSPAAMAMLAVQSAHAAAAPAARAEAPAAPVAGLQLAQTEVDVYVDQYGRRLLVNPWTGQVVGVIEPEREPRYRVERRGGYYDDYYDDGYYEDDYYITERELRARERRERRMRELGRLDQPNIRAFPPAPQYEERRALPEPVERQPLEDTARLDVPEEPAALPEIVEPRTGGLPDPAQQPQPAMPGASEDVARIQIVLDRMGASPGVIDGRIGDNVNKAIAAYRDLTGQALRTYDREAIEALLEQSGGDAFTTYEITPTDVAGPYVASIPEDYGEKARMERLGYTSVVEMLAERFHMDERYLVSLNPGVDFNRPGSRVKVANVPRPQRRQVERIVADKSAKQVRGYGADGRLVVAYPATIGSEATPSPTGTYTIERIAFDPEYTYNPRINFQQGNNDRILTIPPGPNGPVGSVWIALSRPTFGIHGTPEPSKIGRTYSNGCIRLTNWDAQELARLVRPGVSVEFVN